MVSVTAGGRRARRAVGLELHQQIVHRGAAVDAQLTERDTGVVCIACLEDIRHLEGDAFQCGARDVAGLWCRASMPIRRAARVRSPSSGAPRPTNAGTKTTPPVSGDRSGQRLDFGRLANEPRLSRSHCTTAPPMKMLPSRAYSSFLSRLQTRV